MISMKAIALCERNPSLHITSLEKGKGFAYKLIYFSKVSNKDFERIIWFIKGEKGASISFKRGSSPSRLYET